MTMDEGAEGQAIPPAARERRGQGHTQEFERVVSHLASLSHNKGGKYEAMPSKTEKNHN